jgi:mRNA-degrading endonuclease RelE of RelBE toxin-antitoxin system
MTYSLELHPEIEIDIQEAYKWYEERSDGLGERFLKAIREKMEDIAQHPFFFGERSKKGFREARVKGFPYLIIYKTYVQKKVVFINTIHHSSKHPDRKYRK